jgi:hypothetical protein
MNLNELTNEEILYLYFMTKDQLNHYESIIEKGGSEDVLDILDAGRITIYNRYTEEALEQLQEDPYYLAVVKLYEKLEPVATLIEETDPSLFSKINENFLNQAP